MSCYAPQYSFVLNVPTSCYDSQSSLVLSIPTSCYHTQSSLVLNVPTSCYDTQSSLVLGIPTSCYATQSSVLNRPWGTQTYFGLYSEANQFKGSQDQYLEWRLVAFDSPVAVALQQSPQPVTNGAWVHAPHSKQLTTRRLEMSQATKLYANNDGDTLCMPQGENAPVVVHVL